MRPVGMGMGERIIMLKARRGEDVVLEMTKSGMVEDSEPFRMKDVENGSDNAWGPVMNANRDIGRSRCTEGTQIVIIQQL
jgi:hypothetical protein